MNGRIQSRAGNAYGRRAREDGPEPGPATARVAPEMTAGPLAQTPAPPRILGVRDVKTRSLWATDPSHAGLSPGRPTTCLHDWLSEVTKGD